MSTVLTNAVTVSNGQITTTSLKIAEVFGKEHFHVIRDIEKLQVPDNFRKSNFGCSEYEWKNNLGKVVKSKMYNITRDGFVILVMGFTGAAAMQFKIAYLEEFNRMEAELRRLQAGIPTQTPKPLPPPKPYFEPETTFYGQPVISVPRLAKLLNIDADRIHGVINGRRAGIVENVELFRIGQAAALRAAGCLPMNNRRAARLNLLTESGAKKVYDYLMSNRPAARIPGPVKPFPVPVKPFPVPAPVPDVVSQSSAMLWLERLAARGYDVGEAMAEVSFMLESCAALNRAMKPFRGYLDRLEQRSGLI